MKGIGRRILAALLLGAILTGLTSPPGHAEETGVFFTKAVTPVDGEDQFDVILEVSTDQHPEGAAGGVAAVLVLDASEEAESSAALERAKRAADLYVQTLGTAGAGPHWVSVVLYGTNAYTAAPWTPLHLDGDGAVRAALSSAKAHFTYDATAVEDSGSSNLQGGLELAYNLLCQRTGVAECRVLLFSGGPATAVPAFTGAQGSDFLPGVEAYYGQNCYEQVPEASRQVRALAELHTFYLGNEASCMGERTERCEEEGEHYHEDGFILYDGPHDLTVEAEMPLGEWLAGLADSGLDRPADGVLDEALKGLESGASSGVEELWVVEDAIPAPLSLEQTPQGAQVDSGGKLKWDLKQAQPVEEQGGRRTYRLEYRVKLDYSSPDFQSGAPIPMEAARFIRPDADGGWTQIRSNIPGPVTGWTGGFTLRLQAGHSEEVGFGIPGGQAGELHNRAGFTLYDGGRVAAYAEALNNSVIFQNIPSGKPYILKQTLFPAGYAQSGQEWKVEITRGEVIIRDGSGQVVYGPGHPSFVVENRLDSAQKTFTVRRLWLPANCAPTRATPVQIKHGVQTAATLEPGPGNGWADSASLPTIDPDTGLDIHYMVETEELPGFRQVQGAQWSAAEDGWEMALTDVRQASGPMEISARWVAPRTHWRPVTALLKGPGGQVCGQVELDASNGWQGVIPEVEAYDGAGQPIPYTLGQIVDGAEETGGMLLLDGKAYEASYENTGARWSIANTVVQEQAGIYAGRVTWRAQALEGVYDLSATVELYAQDRPTGRIKLVDTQGVYAFDNLPRYDLPRDTAGWGLPGDGGEIAYSARISSAQDGLLHWNGYTFAVGQGSGGPVLTLTGQTVITGVLSWVDEGDREGERPQEVELALWADGVDTGVRTQVSGEGDGGFSFGEQPRYDSLGREILYTVTALLPPGSPYQLSKGLGHYDIRATLAGGVRTLTATVHWVDGESSHAPVLLGVFDGKELVARLNTAGQAEVTLPRYRAGAAITYTVRLLDGQEEAVEPGAQFTHSGRTYTCRYQAGGDAWHVTCTVRQTYTAQAEAWVAWEGGEEGKRPAVTLFLLADGEETGQQAVLGMGEETLRFSNLPVYDFSGDGCRYITYSIRQELDGPLAPRYQTTVKTQGSVFRFVNTFDPGQTRREGNVRWISGQGAPEEGLTLALLADGAVIAHVTAGPAEGWRYCFGILPAYHASGQAIQYQVQPAGLEGALLRHGGQEWDAAWQGGDLVCTLRQALVEIPVTCLWNGPEGETVTVSLYRSLPGGEEQPVTAGGQPVRLTLTSEDRTAQGWRGAFPPVERYSGDRVAYRYTVRVEEYRGTYRYHIVQEGTVLIATVEQVYDVAAQGELRWVGEPIPEQVEIQLLADGIPVGEPRTITAADHWSWHFSGLPRFNAGYGTCNYTVQLQGAVRVDGYNAWSVQYDGHRYLVSYGGMDVVARWYGSDTYAWQVTRRYTTHTGGAPVEDGVIQGPVYLGQVGELVQITTSTPEWVSYDGRTYRMESAVVDGETPLVEEGAFSFRLEEANRIYQVVLYYTRQADGTGTPPSGGEEKPGGTGGGGTPGGTPSGGGSSAPGSGGSGGAGQDRKVEILLEIGPDGLLQMVVTPQEEGRETYLAAVPIERPGAGLIPLLRTPSGPEIIRQSVVARDTLYIVLEGKSVLLLEERAVDFADLPEDHWAWQAASFASARGLLMGTGGGRFSPEILMTKGMGDAVMARLTGRREVDPALETRPLTREELACTLWFWLEGQGITGQAADLNTFIDAAQCLDQEAMSCAVGVGLIQGRGAGRLEPGGTATRAEVAQMLMRAMAIRTGAEIEGVEAVAGEKP